MRGPASISFSESRNGETLSVFIFLLPYDQCDPIMCGRAGELLLQLFRHLSCNNVREGGGEEAAGEEEEEVDREEA